MQQLMRTLTLLVALGLLGAAPATAQNANLRTTTLAAAVNTTSENTIRLTATTGLRVGDGLFVDAEYMTVSAISGTLITVMRGAGGVVGVHASGAAVFYGAPSTFRNNDPAPGICVRAANPNVWINTTNANLWVCGLMGETPTVWTGTQVRRLTYNSVLSPRP
jgi:hypothetical protein